jgi:hypothetical protein
MAGRQYACRGVAQAAARDVDPRVQQPGFEQVGFECSPRVERGERGTVFTVRDMRSDPLPIAVTAHALRQ